MSGNFPLNLIIMTLLLTTGLRVVVSEVRPVEVPYPGYLETLNSTLTSLISQLTVYKQYIGQAFKPLETFKEVFPKPIGEFEKKTVPDAPNMTSYDTKDDLKDKEQANVDHNEVQNSSPASFEKTQIAILTDQEVINNSNKTDDHSHPDQTNDSKLFESHDADDNDTNADRKMWEEDEEEDDQLYDLTNAESIDKSEISKQELMTLQRFLNNKDPNIIIFPDDHKSHRESSPNVTHVIDSRIGDNRQSQQQQKQPSPTTGFEGDTTRRCGYFDGQLKDAQLQWNIAIGTNEGSGFLSSCGGVLISPLIAVTSASCLYKKKLTLVRLSGNELWNISFVKLHPQYNDNGIYNDVGLVKLRKRLSIDRSLVPCIPSKQRQAVLGPSTSDSIETVVTDWKFKLRNGFLTLLPIIKDVEIIPNSDCESSYLEYFRKHALDFKAAFPWGVHSSLICAKLTDHIDCEKNLGYQLVSRSSESPNDDGVIDRSTYSTHYSLVGTSTKGKINCDFMKLPGIYTNISFFSPWIRQATNAAVRRPKN